MMIMAGYISAGQTPTAGETGIEGLITISPAQTGPARIGVAGSKPLPNTAFVVRNDEKGRGGVVYH